MEFKLTINNSEISKLLRIFNNRLYPVHYIPLENENNTTIFSVSCEHDDDDLLEVLMEELSVTNIELMVSIPKNPKIKNVTIDSKGYCLAFDDNYNVIKDYCGLWKDMHKIIYNNADENTDFKRERG